MPRITALEVAAYTVPTDAPEFDGTPDCAATTPVLVRLRADGAKGIGYTYADVVAGSLIASTLAR